MYQQTFWIVNKYNNTYYSTKLVTTVSIKPTDVKPDTYITCH